MPFFDKATAQTIPRWDDTWGWFVTPTPAPTEQLLVLLALPQITALPGHKHALWLGAPPAPSQQRGSPSSSTARLPPQHPQKGLRNPSS